MITLLALGYPAAAHATGTLDQQDLSIGSAVGRVGTWGGDGVTSVVHAQTFTSGQTGSLDQVDLPLRVVGNPGVPLTIEIRTTLGGEPTATTIGGGSIAQATILACACPMSDFTTFRWEPIALGTPAPVVAGTSYAIVLSAPGAAGDTFGIGDVDGTPTRTAYEWAGDAGDTYAAGTHLSKVFTWEDTLHDLAFKTYVSPPPGPQYAATVGQPINADGTSNFRANRGVVPVKFTLTVGDAPTCDLPPASIALAQTSGAAIGPVNESTFTMAADTGSSFRVTDCQYMYNLNSKALGSGTYLVEIKIDGETVGSANFDLR